ncbi:hypothetical protein NQ317_000845 [Molorchus minor]|uniref:C2H2-type domain-containing protein n=1 Tax=Molorchus minor TaxID=1323400 RepID=A0ABQ9J9T5_9CUCU|nr:hypothetical protein NQ317_000845 [Molorchus minor]
MDTAFCSTCVSFLTIFNKIATSLEATEEKISLSCEIQQSGGIIKLGDVQTFLSKGDPYEMVNIKNEVALDNGENSFKGPNVKEEVLVELLESRCKQENGFKNHTFLKKDIAEERKAYYVGSQKSKKKSVSEVQMYNCEICEYKTKYENVLQRHVLTFHKDISEVETYKCEICDFRSKYKCGLMTHMTVHRDFSEVEMLQCEFCKYQTRNKTGLKIHMFVHKQISIA